MRALRCVLACQPSWLDRKKRDATQCVSTRCVMPIGNCDWGLNALQIRQVSARTDLVLAVKQCLRALQLALNSARKGNRLAIVLPLCCPSTLPQRKWRHETMFVVAYRCIAWSVIAPSLFLMAAIFTAGP